ncbi:hypothetical protein N7444_003118 [Penicillium canescens]|nr:hypothetical protein N7444_003118 [Penicillium canescens]
MALYQFYYIHRHEQEYNTFTEYQIATDRWNDYVTVGFKTEGANDPLDYTAALTMYQQYFAVCADEVTQNENQHVS